METARLSPSDLRTAENDPHSRLSMSISRSSRQNLHSILLSQAEFQIPSSNSQSHGPLGPPHHTSTISLMSGFAPAVNFAKRALNTMSRAASTSSSTSSGSSAYFSTYTSFSSASNIIALPSFHANKHEPFIKSGPILGKRLRGPLRMNESRGVVFGRDLKTVVRETRLNPGTPSAEAVSVSVGQPRTLEERSLPALLVRCAQHLLIWGIHEEGLFRVSGMPSHISELRREFDAGADFDLTGCTPGDLDPHAVASILKAFIRELPEPLFTDTLLPYFNAAISHESATSTEPLVDLRNDDITPALHQNLMHKPPSLSTLAVRSFPVVRPPSRSLQNALQVLIAQLPEENRDLIQTVVELIKVTAEHSKVTRMPLSNLLLVFCPSLNTNPSLLRALCESDDDIWRVAVDDAKKEDTFPPDNNGNDADETDGDEEFWDAPDVTERDENDSVEPLPKDSSDSTVPRSVFFDTMKSGTGDAEKGMTTTPRPSSHGFRSDSNGTDTFGYLTMGRALWETPIAPGKLPNTDDKMYKQGGDIPHRHHKQNGQQIRPKNSPMVITEPIEVMGAQAQLWHAQSMKRSDNTSNTNFSMSTTSGSKTMTMEKRFNWWNSVTRRRMSKSVPALDLPVSERDVEQMLKDAIVYAPPKDERRLVRKGYKYCGEKYYPSDITLLREADHKLKYAVYSGNWKRGDLVDPYLEQIWPILESFVNNVIQPLQIIYRFETESIRILCDDSCAHLAAFNLNTQIYVNLEHYKLNYFKENSSIALFAWYEYLAHEIAHNMFPNHDTQFEYLSLQLRRKYFVQLLVDKSLREEVKQELARL